MSIHFTQAHVAILARGLLDGGEQLIGRCAGIRQPWWSLKIPAFRREYLVLATSTRVVVLVYRKGWFTGDRLDQVVSYAWPQISELKVGGVFAKKSLALAANGTSIKMELPRGMFAMIEKNLEGANAVVATHAQVRGLGAGAQRPALKAA